VSLLRIANVPARGLSDVTMERLLAASSERKCSVFEVMKNPLVTTAFMTRTRESIEEFVAFVEKTQAPLNDGQSMSLQVWAERFLNETGYLEDLRRSEKTPEAAENRLRNLKDLVAILDGNQTAVVDANGIKQPVITANPSEQLNTFLEELALDSDRKEEKEAQGDAVTLITMHSCKGLEFPHVYIVGLEDGLLPHTRSKVEGTLDEERRLFYVAITRAMQTLAITYCTGRKKYGQLMPCHPSPFLKELPEELVEMADEKAKQPVTVTSGKNMFDAMRSMLD